MAIAGPGGAIDLAGCRHGRGWARQLSTWDVAVAPGVLVHLDAANGSGKSTFLRAAVGAAPARWRRRRFGGTDRWEPGAVRYVPSAAAPLPLVPLVDHLTLMARRYRLGDAVRRGAVDRWGLVDAEHQHGWTLSEGQQQAAVLCLALAGDPAAVLLDEPLAGLDRTRRQLLVDDVAGVLARGAGVLVVSHEPLLQEMLGGVVVGDG